MGPPQPGALGQHARRLQTPQLDPDLRIRAGDPRLQDMKADFGLIRFDNKSVGMMAAFGKPSLGVLGSQTIYCEPVWVHDQIPNEI